MFIYGTLMKKKMYKIIKINSLILTVICVAVMFINQSCSSAEYSTKDVKMEKIQKSPQFNDGKFKNKKEWIQPPITKTISVMWKFLTGGSNRTPDFDLPRQKADLAKFNGRMKNQLTSIWLGHSTLLINIDGFKIITDPVFEKSVSFFGPTRFNGETPVDIEQIKDIDVIIISHNHYDHLNKFSVQKLNSKTKKFIVPLAVGAELEGWGVPREKITELDWWDEIKINYDLTITATPSQHFSGRSITDRDVTLWASFVVKAPNHKIFFSGDSGYFEGFKEIGNKFGPFDMTFLECGAYNENWHHIHMFPEETVMAHLDLKGKVLHPIHWGTFNLSIHPWYEPMMRLNIAAMKSNVITSTPVVGGSTTYGNGVISEKWWEVSAGTKK